MHVLRALQKLLHIKLNLARREGHTLVLQQSRQVVIHIGKHHIHRQRIFLRAPDDEHVQDVHDRRVLQRFENLDFSQRGNGHPFLLVVHQDTLESNGLSSLLVDGFMDLSIRKVSNCVRNEG